MRVVGQCGCEVISYWQAAPSVTAIVAVPAVLGFEYSPPMMPRMSAFARFKKPRR
jgi:hypothetical protein